MTYRIISNGESYKVQKRHWFLMHYWCDEGYETPGMTEYDGHDWNPHVFASLEEAQKFVLDKCRAERKENRKWTVVKVLQCK